MTPEDLDTLPDSFAERVCELVAQIPRGKVMTYGQIAALCGSPQAARIVGGIAHYGPSELPWQRVVNKQGGLARGYHGGMAAQQVHLETDGVQIDNFQIVNLTEHLWRP